MNARTSRSCRDAFCARGDPCRHARSLPSRGAAGAGARRSARPRRRRSDALPRRRVPGRSRSPPRMRYPRCRIFRRSGAPSRLSAAAKTVARTCASGWSTSRRRARAGSRSSIFATAGRRRCSTAPATASVFMGLAADRGDGDGQPLAAGRTKLPRALRHPALAVRAAAALPGRRAPARASARVRRRHAAGRRSDPDLGRQHRAEGAGEAPRARAAPAGGARRRRASTTWRRSPTGASADGARREGAPALRGRAARLRRGRRSASPARG